MDASTPASSRNRNWLKLLAAGMVLAIATTAYFSLAAREAAPDVTFTDLTGKKITSQSLRGKVVMVNFWATSCSVCVQEMPQMVQTYNKYKAQGLEFVAVAMQEDPPNYVIDYVQTRSLPFTVALDSRGDLAKSFGDVRATPTTFVIDKQGKIIKRYLGEPEFDELYKLLDKALST